MFVAHALLRATSALMPTLGGGYAANAREIFARSGTLFPYGFSSPPPSHLPAGPMAIPDLASVWELASGSIPASASPVGRAGLYLDGSLS